MRVTVVLAVASLVVAVAAAPVGASAKASHAVWKLGSEMAGAPAENLGYSAALGHTQLVVGAVGANSGAGVAYILKRTGSTFTKTTTLAASDGSAGANFGQAVAASPKLIVVGASNKNSSTGAAYVFARKGSAWTQQAELTASDGAANDFFGFSVAIVGSEVLVSGNSVNTGSVYVYARSGKTWSQVDEFTAPDAAAGDLFGYSIAPDGADVLVGAPGHNALTGAAYVFGGSGATWTQKLEMTASDAAAAAYFGYSVGADASQIAVGSPFHGANGTAYVFSTAGAQTAELAQTDGSGTSPYGDWFGYNVVVSGRFVAVGAPYHTSGGNYGGGAVYVYSTAGLQTAEIIPADNAANDFFGWNSAALNARGTSLAVGAPYKSSTAGAFYTYDLKH